MAENSKIEWTDHTFNPWMGCTKVSDGCKHCYAETLMDKRYGRVKWGPQGTRVRTSAANWKEPLAWNRKAERDGRRPRVFCASLADVFEDRDELVPWRAELLMLIQQTPNLDWLLLTKRPENVMRLTNEAWVLNGGQAVTALPSNVWIGTSVENQAAADERIPALLSIPAPVRFLSMEPLLGPVDLHLNKWAMGHHFSESVYPGDWHWGVKNKIDWVIVGGESGTDARPVHPDWVRSIREQCVGAGVPFFFKQWGEWVTVRDGYGGVVGMKNHPQWGKFDGESFALSRGKPSAVGCAMVKIGKHRSGRVLDGREWNEFPATNYTKE